MAPESSKTTPRVEIKAKSSDGVMPGDVTKNNQSTEFLRRRFVINRQFPPFCGRNAPCPTKEERDEFLKKRRNFEALAKPLKRTARADLGTNPVRERERVDAAVVGDEILNNDSVRERACVAKKNNSNSLENHSKSQNANMPNKMRGKVKETLSLFRSICKELVQREASKVRRVDLKAARMVRERGKEVNTEIHRIGSVPGVEVGDEFLYRIELLIVGVHRRHQAGIEYLKRGNNIIATSIIASEGYFDDMTKTDVLIYMGHGGNINGRKNKGRPEDQQLEKGNLALKNSISAKNPVRVTRGFVTETSSMDNRARIVTYTYDGLYSVEKYWREVGPHGKIVYKFELKRNPGQPRVDWTRNVVKI